MEGRKIYRSAPCAKFDIGRLESWLTDMAAEGWHLEKRGLLFEFRQGEPRFVRYRLEPKQDFGDIDKKPEQSVRQVYEAYGWEAVTDYGEFFIFRAVDPQAREIHTDPQIHAQSIKRLIRRSALLYLLEAYLVISRLLGLALEPNRWLTMYGKTVTVCFAVLLVAAMGIILLDMVRLILLYRQLKANKPLDHSKPWRRGAGLHRLGKWALLALFVLFFVMLLTHCGNMTQNASIHINDYPGDPPFVTIKDLYPEGEYNNDTSFAGYNHYTQFESEDASVIIDWREYAKVTMPDGRVLEGAMIVGYFETLSPDIALGLAEEELRQQVGKENFDQLPPPQVEVDYVAAYSIHDMPTVILQKGNILVIASFTIDDGGVYPAELWAQKMAKMLNG